MSLAKRIVARWLQSRYRRRYRWKGNVAEGKHTKATISKGRRSPSGGGSWYVEVTTNWGREGYLDSEGTIYKEEAVEAAEDLMAKYDKEIEAAGRDNWA